VEFATQPGFSGATDESFGLDQFEVVLTGIVPEPSVIAVLFGMVAVMRRPTARLEGKPLPFGA
jgi:hypothetical protein